MGVRAVAGLGCVAVSHGSVQRRPPRIDRLALSALPIPRRGLMRAQFRCLKPDGPPGVGVEPPTRYPATRSTLHVAVGRRVWACHVSEPRPAAVTQRKGGDAI